MRKKQFSDFSFQNFFGFWAKNFSDFRPKNFKKLSKLPSTCPEEQFVAWNFFLKFWIVLEFLHKPSAWFSKFYLRVQSKIAEETVFLFSFQNFFGFWAKNFSDFWPKNFKNLSKLPSTCPEEQFVAWIFFKFWIVPIFCRNHWHGSQNSIYESRLKIAEKNCFFFVFFPEFFFDFWAKLFRTFGQIFKKLWKLPSACPQEQLVAWNFFKKFWINLDFLQKPLAWFSNFYLHVQSKNCGRNSFLIFLFRKFSDFERKFFQTFGQKTS